jgi:hypothetical protein
MSSVPWLYNQNRVKSRINESYFYFPTTELKIVIIPTMTINSLKATLNSLPRTCPEGAGRNGVIALPYPNVGAYEAGWSTRCLGRFTLRKIPSNQYRMLGGPQSQSEWMWIRDNFILPLGFKPLTFQPVASGYTDHTIPPLQKSCLVRNFLTFKKRV